MYKATSKLVLGSANFGLEYGLANKTGKISQSELIKILSFSENAGIRYIDTAQAYGDSESRIGSMCGNGRFKMITKIGVDLDKSFVKNNVRGLVQKSCEVLKEVRLYAILLHRPEVLLGDHGKTIIRELSALKEKNIISKIGVSIYSPEILGAISKLFKLDIVQTPFNIFDQKILSSGWSDKLKAGGVEIHTRSIFLQGLLLIKRSKLRPYFSRNWPDLFDSWYNFLKDNNAEALNVALNFALEQDWIDKVVVGVDNVSQLRALIEAEKFPSSFNSPQLCCDDPNLINPSKWNFT